MTRLRVPRRPSAAELSIFNFQFSIEMDTRYLFHPIRFKSLSLPPRRCPFSTPPFSGESGCKNTTFFHSRKIFFQLFFMTHAILPVSQRFARENIFQSTLPERVSPTPEPPIPGAENNRFESWKRHRFRKTAQCFVSQRFMPVPGILSVRFRPAGGGGTCVCAHGSWREAGLHPLQPSQRHGDAGPSLTYLLPFALSSPCQNLVG